ncbi:MAG: sugar phosphate isomerase/epimerase [Kiritimatiellaeota bacterium]|nr:sugar phosphate isomerase/epimerase [Kiritimatiellota bacterium]
MKYSATTVALPHLSMEEQAELLARLGYDGIELRVRRISTEQRAAAEPSNWGYHLNDITPENFARKASDIRQTLIDHGLELAGIASNAPCTDTEQVKLLLEGAAAAGAPFIRVGAAAGYRPDGSLDYRRVYGETVAGYARVLEMSRGTGIKIVLEIHGGTIHPSASLAYRIVSNFDPAAVGVIYDPQNMVRDGYETTALALDLLGAYLAHCHVGGHRPAPSEPDARGTIRWTWQACPMRKGLFNFAELIALLERIEYRHFISVEDFRPAPAEEKLADAIEYLKSLETP